MFSQPVLQPVCLLVISGTFCSMLYVTFGTVWMKVRGGETSKTLLPTVEVKQTQLKCCHGEAHEIFRLVSINIKHQPKKYLTHLMLYTDTGTNDKY